MNVVVLGASVSAQTVRHGTDEVTGYCEVLRRRWAGPLGITSLKQLCYAGSRLSEGGLYRVGHVIGTRPDVCLFEPLVEDTARGRSATRDEIAFVYRSLLRRGILPVTLCLPDPAKRSPVHWEAYDLHVELCARLGVPRVEVDLSDLADPGDAFNGLHTRLAGAERYAETLAHGLAALGDRGEILERAMAAAAALPASLHEATLATPARDTVSALRLRLRPRERRPWRYRLVQAHQIGPFSPTLVIQATGARSRGDARRSVWDPYCHYERPSYPLLDDREVLEPGAPCIVTIRRAPADPPYATARRPLERWPDAPQRSLRPTGPIKVFSSVPVEVELLHYE